MSAATGIELRTERTAVLASIPTDSGRPEARPGTPALRVEYRRHRQSCSLFAEHANYYARRCDCDLRPRRWQRFTIVAEPFQTLEELEQLAEQAAVAYDDERNPNG